MDTSPRDLDALLTHAGWAKALARNLVRDPDRADDLVQRAWLAAMRRPPSDGTPPRRWLATVLRNFARQDARESSRREQREQAVARSERTSGNDPVDDAAALQVRLITAVRELPEPYRSAVWARYYDGLAPREIAARDGVPVDTVKTRLARGLDLLRKRFDREHGGDRSAWMAAFVPFAHPTHASPWTIGATLVDTKWKVSLAAAVIVCGIGGWFTVSGVEPVPARELGASPLIFAAEPSRDDSAKVEDALVRDARAPIAPTPVVVAPAIVAETRTFEPPLRGRVLDFDRGPVAGLDVGAAKRTERSGVTSAADGTFEIARELAGKALEARGPGWATVWTDDHAPATPAVPITILVAPAGRLSGVVLDHDGRPVPNAAVSLSADDESRRPLSDVIAADSQRIEYAARSDEHGRFDLGEAPLVRGSIVARSERRTSKSIEVPIAARDDLEIRFDAAGEDTFVVRGHVRTASGSPAPYVRVAIHECATRTRASGDFEMRVGPRDLRETDASFDLVAVAPGTAIARRPLGTRAEIELRAAAESFEIVLGGEPKRITGRVVDSEGRPVPSAWVWVVDEEYAGGSVPDVDEVHALEGDTLEKIARGGRHGMIPPTRDDGAFTIDGLQDRAYRLRVTTTEPVAAIELAAVRAGTENLRVELDKSGPTQRVAGLVTDLRGRALADIHVTADIELDGLTDSLPSSVVRTDAKGAFELTGVRGRVVRVYANGADIGSYVEPKPGDPLDQIRIALPRTCPIQIDATSSPGLANRFEVRNVRDATVSLSTSATVAGRAVSLHSSTSSISRPIVDGLSDVVTVLEGELTAVLFRDEVEVARIPIVLAEDGLTILRP